MKTSVLFALSVLCLASGCSTAARHTASFSPSPGSTVRFDQNNDTLPVRYRPTLVAVFEKHSLIVTTNTPADLVCTTQFRTGSTLSARIELCSAKGANIIATANNPGWGTWLSPASAREQCALDCIDALDREIQRARKQ
jgi:hypothetical protein